MLTRTSGKSIHVVDEASGFQFSEKISQVSRSLFGRDLELFRHRQTEIRDTKTSLADASPEKGTDLIEAL